jgi:hypothetical protein
MQWLHLLGAVTLVGGAIYGAARKPLAFAGVAVMLLSGLWNLMTHFSGKPPQYHMVLGVKLLLALHVFAMVILAGAPGREAKRARLLGSAAVSGIVILLLSAYLRRGF